MKYEVKKNKKLTEVNFNVTKATAKGTEDKSAYVDYAMPFNFGSKSKKLYQPEYDDTLLQPDRTYWYNDNYDRF